MTKRTEAQTLITTTDAMGLTEIDRRATEFAAMELNDGRPRLSLIHIKNARRALAELEAVAVQQMRDAGETWAEIGWCLGMSKQAAQQRFGS